MDTALAPVRGRCAEPLVQKADSEHRLTLYRAMLTARWVDRVEMELVNRGEAFFHVGGAGHEASAALARHLGAEDWLHLHYRDKALMLARGIPPVEFFHSLLCTAASHSAGRQMSAHLSAPHLRVLSLVGPVGNNALQAVGVAREITARRVAAAAGDGRGEGGFPVVVCAMGDGTTQQGEVLEAISEAVRVRLPVLFLVEDNGLAISTRTRGQTFYRLPGGDASEFLGVPVHRLDGRDVLACDQAFAGIVAGMRRHGEPALVVLEVERLTHHTNADDERVYRGEAELGEIRRVADPVLRLRARLIEGGVDEALLNRLDREVEASVRSSAEEALRTPNPEPCLEARPPLPANLGASGPVPSGNGRTTTMLEALRLVLRHSLETNSRVSLFGEDIEDPKGDVFGLTRGLSTDFPGRVCNSALSESTIVGVSVGRALAGGQPVACIQFADFLPLCYNQIASELGSMWWRTAGGWTVPVIILAPCGGYRPGLGPFHAQTFEGTYAHVPGLDVVMPSSAADAAGLLNAAFQTRRPTLFLYPKVLLNDPQAATGADVTRLVVPPGQAARVRSGDDLTVVTWGATVSLCRRAAEQLETVGVACDLIDLRSLSPWDREAVLASVRRTRRLVVVHEDNLTGGFGSEVAAAVAEGAGVPVAIRRVARPDTYVPCNYSNQLEILPSLRRILQAASEICDLDFAWERPTEVADDVFVLEAVGSSPADQNVTVLAWKVRVGDDVKAGDLLAECEADKATFDLRAPVSGRVEELLAEGERVAVGHPLARLRRGAATSAAVRRVPVEGRPVLRRRVARAEEVVAPAVGAAVPRRVATPVGLAGISFVTGSRVVPNAELASRFPGRTAADILQRTGIESRFYCGEGENVLTLAAAAARAALRESGVAAAELDAILVSTSTPLSISPSLACLLHHELARDGGLPDIQANDILAACSGWLYALQTAFDLCQTRPEANVLVVTAEAMSHHLDPADFDTAIVFGDAATATVVRGPAHTAGLQGRLHRPLLSARGEDGSILSVGRIQGGACSPVAMHGVKVFPLAVRQMNSMLQQACAAAGWTMADLDWIVPHQANGRIIAAAQQRSGVPAERVINNVARYGNTSSSSIPIALAEMRAAGRKGRTGLAAFGGGFTFAAAVLDLY